MAYQPAALAQRGGMTRSLAVSADGWAFVELGVFQRYGLTHCHPGQIRNSHPKHNQAGMRVVLGSKGRLRSVTRSGARTAAPCRIGTVDSRSERLRRLFRVDRPVTAC